MLQFGHVLFCGQCFSGVEEESHRVLEVREAQQEAEGIWPGEAPHSLVAS